MKFLTNILGLTLLSFGLNCSFTPESVEPPRMAKDWLKTIPEGRAKLDTVKSEVRVEVRHRERRIRFEASLLAAYPNKMFVEIGGFGVPSSYASLEGEHIVIYMPPKKVAYQGNAQEGVRYLFGVQMKPKEWVDLLLGSLPPYPSEVRNFRTDKKQTRIEMGDPQNPTLLSINTQTGWLQTFEQKGSRIRTLRFGNPISTTEGNYPSEIFVETEKASAKIQFKKVVANPKLSPEVFQLSIPEGTKTYGVDYEKLLKEE